MTSKAIFNRVHHDRWSRRAALQAGGAGFATAALGALAQRNATAQEATATPQMAGSPVPAANASSFTAEERLAMETIVSSSLAQTKTPGALVGVWYPGRGTWLHVAGIGNLATAAPVIPDDHVRIASITKTFVATVILQLVDEGKLSLEDRLESFIPGIPNGPEITLRQVLGMDAGIYDFVHDPAVTIDYVADPLYPFTPEDALAIIRASTPDFPPGEKVQYCNSNYILLGMIAEQVTGESIGEAIATRITTPLGMTETSFATTPEMPEPYAQGYIEGATDELRDVTLLNPDLPWASGAMISTLSDLGIWAKALADGTLLSPSTQRERLTWGSFQTGPLDVAYGLGILKINGLLGHNGGILGYSLWMIHAPEENATVVVVTNRGSNESGTSDPIFFQLVSLLFPKRFPSGPATREAATPAP
ncbi:MAG: serine hydrolase domain-containing protein [Thermomicrobiales bacterium]